MLITSSYQEFKPAAADLLRWFEDDRRFTVITMIKPEIIRFVWNFVENGENITSEWWSRYGVGLPCGDRRPPPPVCKLNVIKIIISCMNRVEPPCDECGETSASLLLDVALAGCRRRTNVIGNANGFPPMHFYYFVLFCL